MTETYVTYLLWDGCRAPGNLEYNGRLCGQRVSTVPFDRDALLAVADELSGVMCDKRGELSITYGDLQGFARRIREACGVER